MLTVNETGKHAGCYMYRTHEVRGGAIGDEQLAARRRRQRRRVSVVDLKTGVAKEVVGRVDWEALDGIVWTPADRAGCRGSRHRCASRPRCAPSPGWPGV
jgi:hypothetical protein